MDYHEAITNDGYEDPLIRWKMLVGKNTGGKIKNI